MAWRAGPACMRRPLSWWRFNEIFKRPFLFIPPVSVVCPMLFASLSPRRLLSGRCMHSFLSFRFFCSSSSTDNTFRRICINVSPDARRGRRRLNRIVEEDVAMLHFTPEFFHENIAYLPRIYRGRRSMRGTRDRASQERFVPKTPRG